MSRNVFISILGTGYYNKTKYYCEDKNDAIETHFVQEAMLKNYSEKFSENDKAFIFLTKDAKETNWISPAQKDNKYVKEGKSSTYTGLKEILEKLNLPFDFEDVDIKDGNTEVEIWKIFIKVFEVLKSGDKVYFDITHAFRSLPMLVMVLINYAKFLKNIEVKSITYGNYEGREDNYSPILNLTSFSKLQDWTNAAHEFLKFGNIDNISKLSIDEVTPTLRETKGKDKAAKDLRDLNKLLPKFVDNIKTLRGKDIVENSLGVKINEKLEQIDKVEFYPLKPILHEVRKQLLVFDKKDNVKNGFYAAKWCIDNELYQNAITIIKENITTLVCDENNLNSNSKADRDWIDSIMKIVVDEIEEEKWIGIEDNERTKTIINQSKLIKLLNQDFKNVSAIRNDLNHAGYRNNPLKSKTIKSNISELLCSIIEKID